MHLFSKIFYMRYFLTNCYTFRKLDLNSFKFDKISATLLLSAFSVTIAFGVKNAKTNKQHFKHLKQHFKQLAYSIKEKMSRHYIASHQKRKF